MKRMTHTMRLAAVASATMLVLAACGSEDSSSDTDTDAGDDTPTTSNIDLKIGTALPQTGNLAFLGPPEEAGVGYAASLIEEADTGLNLEIVYGDSGDTDNKAYESEIPRLLGEDVSAIIGAASSGTSLQFIDQVVDAGVIQFSPANTSDAFTTYEDDGLYWRTAPSDVLQGDVLGNLIAADGAATLGMIVLNDSYGTGLAKYVTEAFEGAGGEVVAMETYNTGDTSFDSQVSAVLAANPDAIALITFEEVATILPSLFGEFPSENLYKESGQFPKGLDEFSYAAESFDAVNLIALAALAAGSSDPADIAGKLQEVSGGTGEGEKCTTFADCAEIIQNGGTADYDGISGPITFDEVGDPQDATIGIYQYGDDNTYAAYTG